MRAIPASSPSEANPDRLPTGKASQKAVVCSTHISRVRLASDLLRCRHVAVRNAPQNRAVEGLERSRTE